MPTLLCCTVGGSHEPILTAIRQTRPDHVCFICSEDDRSTGRSGSRTRIEGQGKVIKAHPKDDKPSLPNIPAQLNLPADRFEVLRIPRTILTRPAPRSAGGTKTMTAALVVSALEEGIELQLVTGGRADLVRVGSGMESVFSAPTAGKDAADAILKAKEVA